LRPGDRLSNRPPGCPPRGDSHSPPRGSAPRHVPQTPNLGTSTDVRRGILAVRSRDEPQGECKQRVDTYVNMRRPIRPGAEEFDQARVPVCRRPGRMSREPGWIRSSVAAASRCLAFMAVLAAGVAAGSTASPAAATGASAWSRAVTSICTHALLFEGRHQIGTRAGAVSVARDIRASTERRLRRIRALPVLPPQQHLAIRWLRLERRLAAVYASSYVRIFDAIAAAITPRERALLPRILGRLVHAPDKLRTNAASLDRRLHVPDCTGGATPGWPSV
jgi:hypothetical protein